MNQAILLQYFDRISEAPDAISRLRQFILDLAVRGILVEQSTNDEPVTAFLNRIGEHKAHCGRGSEARNANDIPQLGNTPFAIPANWRWVSFGCVVVSRDSERVPVSKEERSHRPKVFDYYGASGIIDKIDAFLFDKPLLLIGEDGANLINRSTPIAFIARGQYWVNNHAHVLDGISEAFLRFLALHINAIDLKPYVTGTAQPKMNQAKMNGIPIALPPESEQTRIISKVDELMALCDQLEAAQKDREGKRDRLAAATLNRLNCSADAKELRGHSKFFINQLPRLSVRADQIKKIRQAILSTAIRGRLVCQNAQDEPASRLLARINEIWTTVPVPNLPDGEKPYAIPPTWQWVRFGQLITAADAGWSPQSESFPRAANNWGVLKVSAVSWDRFLPEENKQLLPGTVPPEQAKVHAGDFLISRANTSELVAKCVVVEQEPAKLILSDKIVRLQIADPCSKKFLSIVNNHAEHAREYYAEQASGTSFSMKNVSRAVIYGLPIPLPPAAEQLRIVAKVDDLINLCDQLETQLTMTQNESRRLLEAVLHEVLNPVT